MQRLGEKHFLPVSFVFNNSVGFFFFYVHIHMYKHAGGARIIFFLHLQHISYFAFVILVVFK